MDTLRLLGYSLEEASQKNCMDIVGKYGDDIKYVLSVPFSTPGSAVKY